MTEPGFSEPYEPPRIERVVTAAEFAGEVLYAGEPGPSELDNPAP